MKEVVGKMFHVVLSSATGEVICRDEADYTMLENLVGISAIKCGMRVAAYAVMSNHVHVALLSEAAESFIKRVKLGYVRYFNSKYLRSGALFKGQVYSEPVLGYMKQRVVLSYILRNPIHHGICETAFEYGHSSINAYFQNAQCMVQSMITGRDSQFHAVRIGSRYVRYPVDSKGRMIFKHFVDSGWVEHVYRTLRSFINFMNRWNTEDWEREQKSLDPDQAPVSLCDVEPGFRMELEMMRAYERGTYRLHVADVKVCEYVDNVLLPMLRVPSYTCLRADDVGWVVRNVKDKFHVSSAQAYRCLGLRSMAEDIGT